MKIRIRKSSIKRVRMCGFRKRMSTKGGRAMINRRRAKGRKLNTTWSFVAFFGLTRMDF